MSYLDEAAKVIWETSRADEGTISATGAMIVAKALDNADLLVRPRKRLYFGVECGQRWYRRRSWHRYKSCDNLLRFRRFDTGFAFGPLMWWYR